MNETAPARRSRGGLALLAGGAALILVALGSWQVQRLAWKEALIAERRQSLAMPAAALVDLYAPPPEFRRVTATGEFLHDKSLLVGPRSRRGRPGWRLVTPMRLAAGRGIVFVDRGWVPDRGQGGTFAPVERPTGPVTVEGIVRRPAPPGPFAPANDPGRGDWFRVDPVSMAQPLRLAGVAPFWVVAIGDRQSSGYPVPEGTVPMPANNHLQYAITWYSLAVAALVVAAIYWRRERK